MVANRLLSIAAGVTPELETDPAAFVAAAAQAGWPATGVWFDAQTWTDDTAADVRRRLDDTGLIPVDMEVVRMGTDRDCGEALIDAAAAVGASNILTVSAYDDPARTADRFAELCVRAEPLGIRVCIEFMRFTTVRTLADAIEIVGRADQPNSGILVDLLHVARSGTTFDEIAAVDPALFPYAQWCDGSTEPRGWDDRSLIVDALDDRCPPGEGDLRAADFEALFAAHVPFSVEVRSRTLREKFPDPVDRARELWSRTQPENEMGRRR